MLCKFDIKDAFKICPVRKDQWKLFCVRWNNFVNVLMRLSFGCRSPPKIFDTMASSVCYNIECIFHLLDNFLTTDRPQYDANIRYQSMLKLFEC